MPKNPHSAQMFDYESEELLKRVSWMYYEDGLNQQEIADKLKLSRTKVLRLLQESRSSGFVKISLDIGSGVLYALEKKLCHMTGLDECFIVPAGRDVLPAVAKGLAYRFKEALRTCPSIGVGGGRTLHTFARELEVPDKVATREIVSIIGNTKPNLAVEPYDIASTLVAKVPAEFFHVWAPARVNTESEAEMIMRMPSIRKVLEKAENVDIAFVGIGDMYNSSYVRYSYLDDAEMERLSAKGAVGEIMGRFFDIGGVPLDKDFNKLYISVPLPMKGHVFGAAGGPEKFKAILGAVRTGWLSGLITDEVTANALIRALHTKRRG